MRKTILITVIVLAASIGWYIWPVTALYKLVRSVEARDAIAVVDQIDPLSIRQSLADQILTAYSRAHGPLPRNNLIMAITGSIADPLLAAILTPEGVTLLLQSGWVNPELVERPADALGLSGRALGDAWQVFVNSEHGFDRFAISFPSDRPSPERIGLQWRLHNFKWRLYAIRVPERLADRLVERIGKAGL
jgi:hypothetical protein